MNYNQAKDAYYDGLISKKELNYYEKNEITITELKAWIETDLLILKRQLKKLE